ncbi:MAG: VTT domain-containing protein [Syntrophomonadaceae bacterium]|nr:VTT domain-containing protein [Syntrophomonadaceae bacterium]
MVHHFQSISQICEYIGSLGFLAPLAALLLFVLQSLLPIFPYSVLVAVAVVLFGGPEGYFIAITGAVMGSFLCFKLSSGQGGARFGNMIWQRVGFDTRQTNPNLAFSGIFLAHMIQLIPNAVINFLAAVSQVPLRSFLASTVLGLIPVTLAYAGLGVLMYRMEDISRAAILMVATLLLLYLGKNLVKRNWPKLAALALKSGFSKGKKPLSIEKTKA